MTTFMFITGQISMELMDTNKVKHKETHLNLIGVTICLRMISGNGELEEQTIFIKYSKDFIDQMMAGLVL